MKIIVYSDGLHILAGFPCLRLPRDDATYPNPHVLDPLRVMKPDSSSSVPLVITGINHIPFGHGKYARPELALKQTNGK